MSTIDETVNRLIGWAVIERHDTRLDDDQFASALRWHIDELLTDDQTEEPDGE